MQPAARLYPGAPDAAIALLKAKAACCSFPAPEAAAGRDEPALGQVLMVLLALAWRGPRLKALMEALATVEVSPNTGARKLLPQAPLMVKSSMGDQLNE